MMDQVINGKVWYSRINTPSTVQLGLAKIGDSYYGIKDHEVFKTSSINIAGLDSSYIDLGAHASNTFAYVEFDWVFVRKFAALEPTVRQTFAFRTELKPSDGEWGVDKDFDIKVYFVGGITSLGEIYQLLTGDDDFDILIYSAKVYLIDSDRSGNLSTEEISKGLGEEFDSRFKESLAKLAVDYTYKPALYYLTFEGIKNGIAAASAYGGSSVTAVAGFGIPVDIYNSPTIQGLFGYAYEGNPVYSGNVNFDQNIIDASCPVNLTVRDQYGRIASTNGTNQIPNASIIKIGDTKAFYIPTNLIYFVSVDAYDAGSFNLTSIISNYESINTITFKNISIENGTIATIEIIPDEMIPKMQMDYNGDGIIDEIMTPNIIETSHIDLISPSNIANLHSNVETTWINWSWINPHDSDFNHTEIYLNGSFQRITSNEYFNATNLSNGTEYTISTRTVDMFGNINETWMNNTAITMIDPPVPPPFPELGTAILTLTGLLGILLISRRYRGT